jgi:hypothetical protein
VAAATPAGCILFFYAVDVAEAVNLPALNDLLGGTTRTTPLVPRSTAPAYLQYQQAPVVIDGDAMGIRGAEGFGTSFKVFDYGVVSVALRREFSGEWADLVRLVADLMSDDVLGRAAERACTEFVRRIGSALVRPQTGTLSEDYLVVTVSDTCMSADELLRVRGTEVAQIVVGEREPLSTQEREEILRHRMSYLADDLLVPAWSAAFLYDGGAGAQSTLDILEFANSQLLEFRYYDQRLDADLTRIYADLQAARPYATPVGRRYEHTARQLHSLFIEVSELTERTENALKFIGDAHAARLFALVAARLGLSAWKASVRDKLQMLDSIYRFTVEQSAMTRGHILELTIVLILVFELALVFMGVLA